MVVVKIRKAEKQDIPKIKSTATKAWYDTYQNLRAASTIVQFLEASYSEERLEKRLKDSLFLVAENEEEVIGFASFINGQELFLSAIYVMPDYQRHNVGETLLNAGIQQFPQYDALFVEVASDNAAAEAFYAKHQFERIRTYDEELFGEPVQTMLLKKPL